MPINRNNKPFTDAEKRLMLELWKSTDPNDSQQKRCRQIARKMHRSCSSIVRHISAWLKTEEGRKTSAEIATRWAGIEAPIPEPDATMLRLWDAQGTQQEPRPERVRIRVIAWNVGYPPAHVTKRLIYHGRLKIEAESNAN